LSFNLFNYMKKNLYKTLFTTSVIFLILNSFVFIFLYKKINTNKKTAEESEIMWQQEVNRRDGIRSQNSSIKKIEKDKDLLELHFANSSNIVPFLDTIEDVGKKVGIKAEVTLVDIPKESGNLIIQMKAVGSFEKLYKFLLLLENSSYELEFISVNIENVNFDETLKNETKNKNPEWVMNIRMKLLSFTQ
jgi:hypothetical protein